MHLRQRQRPSVKLAVVDRHAHHFSFLSETSAIGPAVAGIETVDAAGWPGADMQFLLEDGERVGLRVIAEPAQVLPRLAVVAVDVSAVVAGGVELVAENRQGLDALAVRRPGVAPPGPALVPEETCRAIER